MDNLIEMIKNNKEWIFSGIGVAIFSTIIGFFLNKSSSSVKNKIGNKSYGNIQTGRDCNIGDENNGD